MSTTITGGHPGVGLMSSMGAFYKLRGLGQCSDLWGNDIPCDGGGGTVDTGGGGGGFDWAGLVSAITAGGIAATNAIKAANTYPYPYGNPYSAYGSQGITPQMLAQFQATGSVSSVGFGSSSTMMFMMVGLVLVMMVSMRR